MSSFARSLSQISASLIAPITRAEEQQILGGGKIGVESLLLLEARPCAGESDAEIPAAVYTSQTERQSRQTIVEEFKHGKVPVLCVVDVLNEGADLPFIECLLFLRPTESKRIFYQQLGRGLRKYVGKSHCTVIDFIGNFKNAHRILDYQGLLPFEEDEQAGLGGTRTRKEILNLPLGCEVNFDDRVIEVFASQTLDPAHANRHNIRRILLYQYERLARRLGRKPTKIEIDRNYRVNSPIYATLFGSWGAFEQIMSDWKP